MRYRDFERDVKEYFGLNKSEAALLSFEMTEAGFNPTEGWKRDDPLFWEIAVELVEFGPLEEFPLDPTFPKDDYLDPGEEWEMTADYEDPNG